jgi:hypothetical protein
MILRICSSDHTIFGRRFFFLLGIATRISLLFHVPRGVTGVNRDVFDVEQPREQQSVVTVVNGIGFLAVGESGLDSLGLDRLDEPVSEFHELDIPHLLDATETNRVTERRIVHEPLDSDHLTVLLKLAHGLFLSRSCYQLTGHKKDVQQWMHATLCAGAAKNPSGEGLLPCCVDQLVTFELSSFGRPSSFLSPSW